MRASLVAVVALGFLAVVGPRPCLAQPKVEIRPPDVLVRAEIVLLAATGMANKEIAEELEVTPDTVGRWRSRFGEKGIDGIKKDRPRCGRNPTKRSRVESRILKKTTQEKPSNATHWSTRTHELQLGPLIR